MIKVEQLKKMYGDKAAVDGISFRVEPGEIFGLLGPNGAGKTTTMEMIEGLREMDGGEVWIDGLSVKKEKNKVRTLIGIQLQSTSMFDLLTVEETLRLYASFYRSARPVEEILNQMNLQEKRKDAVKALSGGQKQRLAIGLALIHDPKVIFLDEPTTGLDPQARRSLWDIISQLKNEGKTIVLSTHYMEEAEYLCQRLAIMDQGKIMGLDTPDNLIAQLNMESAIQFTYGREEGFPYDEIAELTSYKQEDDSVILYTSNLQASLTSLIRWADANHIPLEGLLTRRATLEDVFLHLTGRSLRD